MPNRPDLSGIGSHDQIPPNEHSMVTVNSVSGASVRSNKERRQPRKLFQEDKLPPINDYVHGSKLTGYFCKHPACKTPHKTHKLASRVKKHARNHYKPVICPVCPEKRAEQQDMKKHVQVYHNFLATILGIPGESLPCSICREAISNSRKDNFKRHMRNSHGIEMD
ncbi:hypothetical protein LB506_012542 [Fusarium annulatum]|nr:hypothetical protein LB506_012542 [Fusarium annulatum]